MSAVYKYTMTDPVSTFDMPEGAFALTAAAQYGHVCIWAQVKPHTVTELRTFQVVGTGHDEISDDMTYIGTAILDGGHLVLHVYEVER